MFLAFLLLFIRYNLLLGVPPEVNIPSKEMIGVNGVVPHDLVIFIIDRIEQEPLDTIEKLSSFADAEEKCNRIGKALKFEDIDSDELNFLEKMREQREYKLKIDANHECACKASWYRQGLLEVRVPDTKPNIPGIVLRKIQTNVSIAFIYSTDELFKY